MCRFFFLWVASLCQRMLVTLPGQVPSRFSVRSLRFGFRRLFFFVLGCSNKRCAHRKRGPRKVSSRFWPRFPNCTRRSLQGECVFVGSQLVEWLSKARYLADDEGSVFGLATFGDELAGYSEARSPSLKHAPVVFGPNAKLLSLPGTKVMLCFTVSPAGEG